MGVGSLLQLVGSPRNVSSLDEWTSNLHSICGHFQPRGFDDRATVRGLAAVSDACGIEIAHIATDVDVVERSFDDIRSDYGENVFLGIQIEGECGIEQHGHQSLIFPGDCILIDASSPSAFHFRGKYSNQLSVHLPRQLLFAKKDIPFHISRRLDADDPMATMLRALVAKLIATNASDHRARQLRELLLDVTRQAFSFEGAPETPKPGRMVEARIEMAQSLIDRNLTDERLTPQWLADKMGVSLRTLQVDLNVIGVTPTSLIRNKRLQLARDTLCNIKSTGNDTTIAGVAYSAGFNDISYFNRCFKKTFECAPRDIMRN